MMEYGIYRGETPTLIFEIEESENGGECDLGSIDKLAVSFSQNDEVLLRKTLADCSVDSVNKCIAVPLSEEDTLKFSSDANPVSMQIRGGIGDTRLFSGLFKFDALEPVDSVPLEEV